MSDSVRPQRRQPTRLPCPWDSPGKNTGVGCHFFSNAWKWKVKVKSLSRVRLFWPRGLQPTRLLRPWDFPGKSTGVGCHCLLLRMQAAIYNTDRFVLARMFKHGLIQYYEHQEEKKGPEDLSVHVSRAWKPDLWTSAPATTTRSSLRKNRPCFRPAQSCQHPCHVHPMWRLWSSVH